MAKQEPFPTGRLAASLFQCWCCYPRFDQYSEMQHGLKEIREIKLLNYFNFMLFLINRFFLKLYLQTPWRLTCCWLGVPSPLWPLLIMMKDGSFEKEIMLLLWWLTLLAPALIDYEGHQVWSQYHFFPCYRTFHALARQITPTTWLFTKKDKHHGIRILPEVPRTVSRSQRSGWTHPQLSGPGGSSLAKIVGTEPR